jgi:hypothetical protein
MFDEMPNRKITPKIMTNETKTETFLELKVKDREGMEILLGFLYGFLLRGFEAMER